MNLTAVILAARQLVLDHSLRTLDALHLAIVTTTVRQLVDHASAKPSLCAAAAAGRRVCSKGAQSHHRIQRVGAPPWPPDSLPSSSTLDPVRRCGYCAQSSSTTRWLIASGRGTSGAHRRRS
jgi:hypothetical protein